MRFARAEAASRGRAVLLVFEAGEEVKAPSSEEKSPGLRVKVYVLTDSFEDEGPRQVELKDIPWAEDSFYEAIRVESVRPLAEHEALTGSHPSSYGVVGAGEGGGGESDELPSIRFYADGSSDSAEIVLAARDEKSPRREQLRLIGMTGTIVRRQLRAEEEGSRDQPQQPGVRHDGGDGQGLAPDPFDPRSSDASPIENARQRRGREGPGAARTEEPGRHPGQASTRMGETTLSRRSR